jgi:cold shock CspA family protein
MRGTVNYFSDYRGFGFVLGADKVEYFVHVSQIKADGHKTLQKGQEVIFTPTKSGRGPQARDVSVNESEGCEQKPDRKFVLKKNPFTPQDPMIHAKKFAGRKDSILNAVDALFNNKNVLIVGPRGLGKSSLSYQLMYLTQGQEDLLQKLEIDLGDFVFSNSTGDHRCVPGNSLLDICNGLIFTLSAGINENIDETKKKIVYGIDLKIFKFTTEEEIRKVSPTDVSLSFVTKVEEFFSKIPQLNKSITFVIDEIDVLDNDIEIASFLKATSEKFTINNRIDVSFIISGVTGTVTKLISQHASVSRLFETIPLPRMNQIELEEIIDNALVGTGVEISEEAKNEIVSLANNFPQPVHLLGYHSFKLDSNNIIEIDDVNDSKTFIVSEIKKQDFESKFEGIAPGAMTEVVRVLAQAPFETVNLSYLRANLRHMSDEKILGTTGGLFERSVIEKQHRGVFRFNDPLFKIYLRWLFGMEEIHALTQSIGRNGLGVGPS